MFDDRSFSSESFDPRSWFDVVVDTLRRVLDQVFAFVTTQRVSVAPGTDSVVVTKQAE